MIIAGAGGHALEVCEILIYQNLDKNLCFFDDVNPEKISCKNLPILKSVEEINQNFQAGFKFVLGTGNPKVRLMFHQFFSSLGGAHYTILGQHTVLNKSMINLGGDVMHFAYLGSSVTLGKGSLINVGAQIHHEATIGQFSEINPGAIILGKAEVGNFSIVGSGAKILPKVKIGDNAIIGAGSVVTKDIPDFSKVIGVPGRIVGKVDPI